jgi:hypothetical protein
MSDIDPDDLIDLHSAAMAVQDALGVLVERLEVTEFPEAAMAHFVAVRAAELALMFELVDAEGRAEFADQVNAVLASAGIHYRLAPLM